MAYARGGAAQPDGIQLGPGEHLSNVRVVVNYGNLKLRGQVQISGGKLPPHLGIYANATRLNETGPPRVGAGADVDARGQFVFEKLLPGEYEVRLVALNYQPGEPRDQELGKLISSVRQKVTLNHDNQPAVILVVDLSRKGNQ